MELNRVRKKRKRKCYMSIIVICYVTRHKTHPSLLSVVNRTKYESFVGTTCSSSFSGRNVLLLLFGLVKGGKSCDGLAVASGSITERKSGNPLQSDQSALHSKRVLLLTIHCALYSWRVCQCVYKLHPWWFWKFEFIAIKTEMFITMFPRIL